MILIMNPHTLSMLEDYKEVAKIITRKIKKLKKTLYELKYFTEFHMELCEKNNNILLYFKNKYPAENIYIGYLNHNKLLIYNKVDRSILQIIKSNIFI